MTTKITGLTSSNTQALGLVGPEVTDQMVVGKTTVMFTGMTAINALALVAEMRVLIAARYGRNDSAYQAMCEVYHRVEHLAAVRSKEEYQARTESAKSMYVSPR